MASMTKIDYPSVKNYIAKFSWSNKALMLMLGYNIDNKFQFINLETGQIMNLIFDTVEDAEEWINTHAEVLERNVICQTYVP